MADGKLVKAPDGSLWRIGYDAEGKVASFEPDSSSEPAESLPRTTEEMAAQDALMAPPEKGFLETVSGAGAKMVPQALERIKALYPGNWPGIAEALLRPGTNEDVLPGASTGPSTGLKFINEILRRPGATRLAGSLAGGAAVLALSGGNPVAAYTGAQGGGELMNQLNQSVLGTAPDVPWQEDKENLIAGGAIDAVTGGVSKLAASKALKGTRDAQYRAGETGIIGSKLGTPKGTTGVHTILSETLARHRDVIQKYNPFKGVDINDPAAFDRIIENTQAIKDDLLGQKTSALQRAEDGGVKLQIGLSDIDQMAEELTAQGVKITDGAIDFAKEQLINELNSSPLVKAQYEAITANRGPGFETRRDFSQRTEGLEKSSGFKKTLSPGESSQFRRDNEKLLTPLEAQEYLRRNIDDRLNELGKFDTSAAAKGIIDSKEAIENARAKAGLELLRDLVSKKLEGVSPEVSELNRGISAMIDLDEQLRMGQAGVRGAESVPHGAGVPGKLDTLAPSWWDRAVNTVLPGSADARATARRTATQQSTQSQMLGPIQDAIRFAGGKQTLGERGLMKADQVSKMLGGDGAIAAIAPAVMSPSTLTPDQVPQLFGDKPQAPMQFQRDSNVIRQMPEQFAATVQQAAFETLLKQTGSPEVASSVAHRMSREALQIAASPSDTERAEGIAAIAKTLPQAFLPGEYPDEMDGTVVQPTSKLQLEDNAKAKLQSGQVDSITYAKQKQEAFKSGPSRIIIRKSGQLTPAQPASNPNAVMMQANTPNY